MSEPDQFRVEREHQQLAFGTRLVEFAEPHGYVAPDNDRALVGVDDDCLEAAFA